MKLASVRLIAADIKVMVSFYEMVTGLPAEWPAPVFAEIVTPAATLARQRRNCCSVEGAQWRARRQSHRLHRVPG